MTDSLPLKNNSRNYVIDNAKLLCLFIILYCHIPPAQGFIHSLAYSFHVPIFFLVAGMFFKNNPIKYVAVHSAQTLLVPYLIFNLLVIICSCTIAIVGHYGFDFTRNVLHPVYGILLGNTSKAAPYLIPGGPSWFLVALFCSRSIFSVILHSSILLRCIEVIVLVIIYFVTHFYIGWGLFSIDAAILGLPFLAIGFWARKYFINLINANIKYRLALLIICAVALISVVQINGLANMFEGKYGSYFILFVLCGVIGSVMVFMICSFMNYSNRVTRMLIDGSTFFICMHILIMEYVELIYRRAFSISSELVFVDKMFVSIAVVFICLGCIFSYKKLRSVILSIRK